MRISISVFLLVLIAALVSVATSATFEEAKALSAQSGKPVLLEFIRED
jgi:hypothetical protein